MKKKLPQPLLQLRSIEVLSSEQLALLRGGARPYSATLTTTGATRKGRWTIAETRIDGDPHPINRNNKIGKL